MLAPETDLRFEVAVSDSSSSLSEDMLPPASRFLSCVSHTCKHAALLNSHVQTTVVHIKFCVSLLSVAALNERQILRQRKEVEFLRIIYESSCHMKSDRFRLSLYSGFDCLRKSLCWISHARATIIS